MWRKLQCFSFFFHFSSIKSKQPLTRRILGKFYEISLCISPIFGELSNYFLWKSKQNKIFSPKPKFFDPENPSKTTLLTLSIFSCSNNEIMPIWSGIECLYDFFQRSRCDVQMRDFLIKSWTFWVWSQKVKVILIPY